MWNPPYVHAVTYQPPIYRSPSPYRSLSLSPPPFSVVTTDYNRTNQDFAHRVLDKSDTEWKRHVDHIRQTGLAQVSSVSYAMGAQGSEQQSNAKVGNAEEEETRLRHALEKERHEIRCLIKALEVEHEREKHSTHLVEVEKSYMELERERLKSLERRSSTEIKEGPVSTGVEEGTDSVNESGLELRGGIHRVEVLLSAIQAQSALIHKRLETSLLEERQEAANSSIEVSKSTTTEKQSQVTLMGMSKSGGDATDEGSLRILTLKL